jgi:tetratricopeptide (TPR) repeat protein
MKKVQVLLFALTMNITLFSQSKQSVQPSVASQVADSFYLIQDWKNAKLAYDAAAKADTLSSLQWMRLGFSNYNLGNYDEALNNYNTSSHHNPPQQMLPFLYSRMARIYALKNNDDEAFANLGKAIQAGYFNFTEMDTLKDFSSVRDDEKFKTLREKAYATAFPCFANAKAREFDFWVGEWDVYQTGTNRLVGQSSVQIASGGCMILENWTAIGVPNTGKSMNFVDTKTDKWEQVWVGSGRIGANIFVNGEYRDSAMHFDFEQPGQNGNKLKGRFTFFNQGPNQVRQLNETSPDEGKTWSTAYHLTYIRKK